MDKTQCQFAVRYTEGGETVVVLVGYKMRSPEELVVWIPDGSRSSPEYGNISFGDFANVGDTEAIAEVQKVAERALSQRKGRLPKVKTPTEGENTMGRIIGDMIGKTFGT